MYGVLRERERARASERARARERVCVSLSEYTLRDLGLVFRVYLSLVASVSPYESERCRARVSQS
jgi:hypothetical protein